MEKSNLNIDITIDNDATKVTIIGTNDIIEAIGNLIRLYIKL